MGEKSFKIFSSETSQQTCHRWPLGGQLPKLCSSDPDLGPKWPPSADIVLT
jgi:hypothetical protein